MKTIFILIAILLIIDSAYLFAPEEVSASTNSGVDGNIINNTSQHKLAPGELAALAFLVSASFVLVGCFATYHMFKWLKRNDLTFAGTFWDIIRIKEHHANLGVFQFLVWSLVVTFSTIGFYLFVIFGILIDEFAPTIQSILPIIPYNLLAIMGISAGVCVFSIYVSQQKYNSPMASADEDIALANEELTSADQSMHTLKKFRFTKGIRFLSEMILGENHKISLIKFQMFFWTWILVAIYLITFFSQTNNIIDDMKTNSKIDDVGLLNFPDIQPAFVIIMAISQGAFVGNSLISQKTIKVVYIFPTKVKANEMMSIFGTNFGTGLDRGAVWLELNDNDLRIPDESIMLWSDNRIDIKVPPVKGSYHIRVVAEGRLTEQTPKAKFEVFSSNNPP